MENKKSNWHKYLQEIEKSNLRNYETIASHINDVKTKPEKNLRKLKSDVDKHGDGWHKAIDKVIQKYKSDIDEMKKKTTKEVILNKHEDEIARTCTCIN